VKVDSDSDDDWGDKWQGDKGQGDKGQIDKLGTDVDLETQIKVTVDTYNTWQDAELHNGILEAINQISAKVEEKKLELGGGADADDTGEATVGGDAGETTMAEKPKYWKKRGTSSRGGFYGTYGHYI
jgi:hypothetical protein